MLAADPDAFLDATLNHMAGGIEKLHPAAVAAYREARFVTLRCAVR
jgi:haloacetate dehalogenase